jgi:endonuclease/exonuclease/phosphatase (EEP) superfamily protein YafD
MVVIARQLGGGEPWPLPKVAPFGLLVFPVALVSVILALLARRRIALVVALLLLTPLLVWEVPQLWPGGDRPAAGAHPFTVMAFNTKVGEADPGALLSTLDARHVDILVLAESSAGFVQALQAGGLASRLPYSVPGDPKSSVQLWSRWKITALAPLAGTTDPGPRGVVSTPWGDVTVTGLHAIAPTGGRIAKWKRDLRAVQTSTQETTGRQVVAGDFNASLDHGPFRDLLAQAGLVDATDEAGLGHGSPALTWPANRSYLPPLVAIDHVLAKGGIGVSEVSTVEVDGSDHRALVASLTLAP